MRRFALAKVAAEPSEGVSVSRNERMILTSVRRLAPIASQGSALPGQRRSVSLRFRVAMLLKTQFACHRKRGKLTLRKKEIVVFIILNAFDDILCQILRYT